MSSRQSLDLQFASAGSLGALLLLLSCGGDDGAEMRIPPGPALERCAEPLAADRPQTRFFCACEDGADDDCVPGDDANDGLSPDRPQLSLPKAAEAFDSLPSGGAVALCRGGAWRTDGLRLFLTGACSAETPCVLADYGAEDKPRPKLVGVSDGQPTINLDAASDEPRRGFALRNLHLTRDEATKGTGVGVLVFRDVGDVVLSCLIAQDHGIGVQLTPNGLPAERIRVEDSLIFDNASQGFLGGCDGCEVLRTHFVNNGYEGSVFNHNLYISQADSSARGMRVADCLLQNNAVNAETGQCSGTSLNVHGGLLEDLVIENNVIEEPPGKAALQCWGISVDASSSSADTNLRTIIRGNTVRNVGNVGIGVASCVDCIIENNLVIQTSVGGAYGIVAPNTPTSPPDADLDAVTVRNNTVYFEADAPGSIGISVGERGTDHTVTSNIVYMDPASDPPGYCYAYDLDPSQYALVDANLGFGCENFEFGTMGMDPNQLLADPGFVDPPRDFTLGPMSPARDSGSAGASAANDFEGQPRDGSPDRGAFEAR